MSNKPKEKRPRGRPPLSPEEREKRRLAKNKKARIDGKAKREATKAVQELIAIDKEEAKTGVKVEPTHKGRAKGQRNIYTYESVKRLMELNFDPLQESVELFRSIQAELDATFENAEGKTIPVIKRGSQAHATMLATQKGITDQLAKYGYRAVPEKKEVVNSTKVPTIISLTPAKKKEDNNDDDSPKDEAPSDAGSDT